MTPSSSVERSNYLAPSPSVENNYYLQPSSSVERSNYLAPSPSVEDNSYLPPSSDNKNFESNDSNLKTENDKEIVTGPKGDQGVKGEKGDNDESTVNTMFNIIIALVGFLVFTVIGIVFFVMNQRYKYLSRCVVKSDEIVNVNV